MQKLGRATCHGMEGGKNKRQGDSRIVTACSPSCDSREIRKADEREIYTKREKWS